MEIRVDPFSSDDNHNKLHLSTKTAANPRP